MEGFLISSVPISSCVVQSADIEVVTFPYCKVMVTYIMEFNSNRLWFYMRKKFELTHQKTLVFVRSFTSNNLAIQKFCPWCFDEKTSDDA